ncbi:hypothetical protein K3495_g8094 [Podosphaera aphanis]|nr:hypothetical protein K3495_g8094 [Podosphaera aphanis]
MHPTLAVLRVTILAIGLLAEAFGLPSGGAHIRDTTPKSTPTELGVLKRGLPFNDPPISVQNFHGVGSKVGWAYNWNSNTESSFPPYLEYVPMLWDGSVEHTSKWLADVAVALGRGNSHHLLAFNEPDLCGDGGSCMTPEVAAATYMALLQPLAGRFRLGAPAITNGPSGLPWLKDFLRLCIGCTIDFVPIHWYDSATNSAYFHAYLEQVHELVGEPNIWLTEFRASGTEDEQKIFLADVLPWMDSLAWVERYAWFWCDPSSQMGQLVNSDKAPTALGEFYAYS